MWLAKLNFGILSGIAVYGQYLSATPAVIPLIHKAPYVNSWINTNGNITRLVGYEWPQFFNGQHLEWMIAARVDGTGYILQGGQYANYTASKVNATFITSTRTIFMMDAGPVRFNLTYLTPIELDDWTRHSLPFGHFFLDLWSTDGESHSVQLYSDILPLDNGVFFPFERERTTFTSALMLYHQTRVPLDIWEEVDDLPIGNIQFFAFRTTPRVTATWETCSSMTCRKNFSEVGKLETEDYRLWVDDNVTEVMAFALDMGNITQSENPLVFATGLFKDTTIRYSANGSAEWMEQKPLWQRRWDNVSDAIGSSFSEFPQTLSRATALDTKIVSDVHALGLPTSVTTNLTNLVILSLRQTVGSIEFTTNLTGQGTVRLDDLRIFMKDMGNSRRVNPLEVIYASFPAFLYLNSSLAGKLLEPLFESFDINSYDQGYAPFDLGNGWPNARPNITFRDSPIGIESSGSMLILALAHAQKSGDRSLISRYYSRLLKWADFLGKGSLEGLAQFITADGSNSAMSNLALKAITGIYAMGKINQLLEGYVYGADSSRTSYYLGMARDYARRWRDLSLSSTQDHIVSEFRNDTTWGLLYNLYAVRLIGADFIPSRVYELQASWYHGSVPTTFQSSLTGNHNFCPVNYENTDSSKSGKVHWALLAAGSISQDMTGTRDAIINNIHLFTFNDIALNPSTCLINSSSASVFLGSASAANGAAFAFHALSLPNLISPSVRQNSSRFDYKLVIILTVLSVTTLILAGIFYWLRLRRQKRMNVNSPAGETHIASYLGVLATATVLPSKLRTSANVQLEVVRRPSNPFLATTSGQLGHHLKPSSLRRRAEEIHAPDEPDSDGSHERSVHGDTREEDLVRQVEQLMAENGALRNVIIPPPPYADGD